MLVTNPILHSRTKHFELDLYFIREKIQNHNLFVQRIPSFDQTADILTKPISATTHSLDVVPNSESNVSPFSLQGDKDQIS